jgi:hypothetical protein
LGFARNFGFFEDLLFFSTVETSRFIRFFVICIKKVKQGAGNIVTDHPSKNRHKKFICMGPKGNNKHKAFNQVRVENLSDAFVFLTCFTFFSAFIKQFLKCLVREADDEVELAHESSSTASAAAPSRRRKRIRADDEEENEPAVVVEVPKVRKARKPEKTQKQVVNTEKRVRPKTCNCDFWCRDHVMVDCWKANSQV